MAAVAVGLATSFLFPATGVRSERSAVLLAIDDVSLPLKRNLCLYLSKPAVRREPVLTPSRDNPNAPDSLAAHFYGTVLHDGGRYRMWYYACHLGRNPDWPAPLKAQAERWKDAVVPGPLCYAESADGIHWEKPRLGQLLFKGSRDNNALALPSALTGDACVIKDDDDPDPARRYKLAFWTQFDPWDYPTMRVATSADGITWSAAPKPPIESFLEHASFYRFNGLYIANSQSFLPREGGAASARVGTAWVSPDFDHWLPEAAESFAMPYTGNPVRDEVHLGVGAASFGNVMVGHYCLWHNHPEFGRISGDLCLVVSNDGLAFREPAKGHVWLKAADSPAAPLGGKEYPTVLCQANGILNVGDETRIYHGRWRNAPYGQAGTKESDYHAEVALATLPRDRWGALGLAPNATEGSVWSTPVTLPAGGCEVAANGDGLDGMRVEVATERFVPIAGFSGAGAGTPTRPSGLDCPIRWAGSTLALAGRTVRFRVHLKKTGAADPRLYALYLRVPAQGAGPAITAEEVTIQVGGRAVTARVVSPAKLAGDPLLLVTLAADRYTSLHTRPYCLTADHFLAHGHRAVSLDLPSHGDRVDRHGEGIVGFRNAFVAGEDPFARLVEDGKAVVDECIRRGWARAGRIVVAGTSRGGYMALRLLAADDRIAAGAGFAPVTDWRDLTEFAADGERKDVADLRLARFVKGLARKHVWLVIGRQDERVSTESCQRFHQALLGAQKRAGHGSALLRLTDTPGHAVPEESYPQAAAQLTEWAE